MSMLDQYLSAHEKLIVEAAAEADSAIRAAILAYAPQNPDELDAYVQMAALRYLGNETEMMMSYSRFSTVIPEHKGRVLRDAQLRLDVLRCVREGPMRQSRGVQ